MFIYRPVQISKIAPLDKQDPTTGQQVFVEAHPLLPKGKKYGFLDPRRLATEDMIGKWVDMAILAPSGTFELYPADANKAREFHAYNGKRPSVLTFYGLVKGVHVNDEWHENQPYSHLILVEPFSQEILVDVDDQTFDRVMIGNMIKVNAAELQVLGIQNAFERKIEECLRSIQTIKGRLDQTPSDRIPSAYGMMARYSCEIAVYHLAMGDKDNALQWFCRSHELEQKSDKTYSGIEGTHVMWLLYTAILSKRPDFIRGTAEKAQSVKRDSLVDINYLDGFMIGLILGNEAEALQVAEKFDERERTCGPRAQRYYKGLGTMCLGIARKDADVLKSGLKATLQNHHNKQRGLYGFSYDDLVCFPATVLLLLARNRGVNITPDDVELKFRTYVPWRLLD